MLTNFVRTLQLDNTITMEARMVSFNLVFNKLSEKVNFSTFNMGNKGFETDEAGGIPARNVLQIYEHCDWCAGIF